MKLYKVTQEPLLMNMEGQMGNHPHGHPGAFFCFLCHHKDNNYGCLFSPRYQHYTNYCPVSTPAYINCVAVMRVLVDHHCLRSWEALVDSVSFSLVFRFWSTQWAFCHPLAPYLLKSNIFFLAMWPKYPSFLAITVLNSQQLFSVLHT